MRINHESPCNLIEADGKVSGSNPPTGDHILQLTVLI